MSIAGIDYSLRGPAICIYHGVDAYTGEESNSFSFENSKDLIGPIPLLERS